MKPVFGLAFEGRVDFSLLGAKTPLRIGDFYCYTPPNQRKLVGVDDAPVPL